MTEPNLPITVPFWNRFFQFTGFNKRYFWISFWFILLYLIMVIPIFVANNAHRIQFSPAFLWSCAYFTLGILLGFIFGVPTIITQGTSNPPPNQAITPANAKKIVQANTNLTQISDWLTKLLIGASLVELSKVSDHIVFIAKKMSKGMTISPLASDLSYAAVFAGGIIVAFTVYGFIVGYLIMRTVLTELLAD